VRTLARPSKPVDVLSKNLTKEEYKARKEHEARLKGDDDMIVPSDYLSDTQKEIFYSIVEHMKASNILSNIDVHLLSAYAVAVDRLQWIDSHINRDPDQMLNREVMSARKQHMDDFKRLSNELGFSPQSRAKLGNINLLKKEEEADPLLKVLGGGKG
jgi:P27 family predicted phage terminase small subunit